MKRRPFVAGNWKLNSTLEQASTLTRDVLKALPGSREVEVAICPPFTALTRVAELLRGTSVRLGAQNVHWEAKGAYTGEVSAPMLKEIGCHYCIIGHSERRQLFGETDADVQKKVGAIFAQGLSAIVCVGETKEVREQGRTWAVVEKQLEEGLGRLSPAEAQAQLVVAYEPVWAIGTGLNATPEQAQEVHAQIRGWLKNRFGAEPSQAIRIQYGGSVKPDNAMELMSQPDVDGALVGGASLDVKQFIPIVEAALHAKESKCSTH